MTPYREGMLTFIRLLCLIGAVITQDQNELTTAVGLSATLICTVNDMQLGAWRDVTNDVTIYTVDIQRQPVKTSPAMYDDKYLLYIAEVVDSSQFNLIITSVNEGDKGVFSCTDLLSQAVLIEYNVTIEVPPEDTAASCSSCTREDSTCHCECSASGASSPSMLSLEWKINDAVFSNQPPTEQNTDGGQVIYSSSAVVTVNEDDSVLTCTLKGFENQVEMAGLYPDRLQANKTLSVTTLPSTRYTMESDGTAITIDPNVNIDCTSSSAPALIAICCAEGVIIAIILVIGLLLKITKGWRREDKQNLAMQLNDTTDEANSDTPDKNNPAYMDLQATKQMSSNNGNFEVAFGNLNLKEPLPGKGFIIYQRAEMILTSKREDIVVKTVSDDSPARLAKLQAHEVRRLSRLTPNVNVAQFLGRCNNVPNLLCYEFVNGIKLGHYLRENFQRSKIHQYGNTKQKRYHVAERGSVENLPRIALQIARGMKYLTAQKFLHPGLRSEKVIMDVSGQCKLYDFVSRDNVKDIITILWGKTVPYHWMPPEYLFLDELDPTVDVWSFGVVLWEIFSYGALPYEGKGRSDVEKGLREKERLEMPNNCPGAIWQIALECWEQSPEKRPSFDQLYVQLSYMCNDNKEYDEIHST